MIISLIGGWLHLYAFVAAANDGAEIDMRLFGKSNKGGYLSVILGGQEPRNLNVEYTDTQTAGELINQVANIIGVEEDYVVLFRQPSAVIDGSRRVIGPNRYSHRIGASSSWKDADTLNQQTLKSLGIRSGDNIQASLRPLKGDHIHYAVAFNVHGELVDPIYDQNWIGPSYADEGKEYPSSPEDLATNINNTHIIQLNPHFGIHGAVPYWTGYGWVHAHPGTSWTWLRSTQGLGATLDTYFEMIGVGYWDAASNRYPFGSYHVPSAESTSEPHVTMTFPERNLRTQSVNMVGGTYNCEGLNTTQGPSGLAIGPNRHPLSDFQNSVSYTDHDFNEGQVVISSNATHTWRTYYYSYYQQEKPEVMEAGAGNIWLVENLGMIVLSFERREDPPDGSIDNPYPKPPKCMVEMMSRPYSHSDPNNSWENYYYMLGFDGYPYPMPNAKAFADTTKMYEMSTVLKTLYDMPQEERKAFAL